MANLKNVQELDPSTSLVEGDEAIAFIKCKEPKNLVMKNTQNFALHYEPSSPTSTKELYS